MLTTKENFSFGRSGRSFHTDFFETSLEIKEFPKFLHENSISFCFPCDQQNFPKEGNFLESGSTVLRIRQRFDEVPKKFSLLGNCENVASWNVSTSTPDTKIT